MFNIKEINERCFEYYDPDRDTSKDLLVIQDQLNTKVPGTAFEYVVDGIRNRSSGARAKLSYNGTNRIQVICEEPYREGFDKKFKKPFVDFIEYEIITSEQPQAEELAEMLKGVFP